MKETIQRWLPVAIMLLTLVLQHVFHLERMAEIERNDQEHIREINRLNQDRLDDIHNRRHAGIKFLEV